MTTARCHLQLLSTCPLPESLMTGSAADFIFRGLMENWTGTEQTLTFLDMMGATVQQLHLHMHYLLQPEGITETYFSGRIAERTKIRITTSRLSSGIGKGLWSLHKSWTNAKQREESYSALFCI